MTRASLPQAPAGPPDACERAFVLVFSVIAVVAWLAMVLAWAGWFRVWPLVATGAFLGAAVALAIARSMRRLPRAPAPLRSIAFGAVISLAAGWLLFKPAEYHFDGLDGSVYVALASILEREGTLTPEDPLAASLDDDERAALFAPTPRSSAPARFSGGLDLSADGRRLQPEFLHLFPVWMATAGATLGAWARWYVNPALALGSILALWLLGRRLAGPIAGEAAAVLLAINVAQIWFGRFPSSEIAAQFLVLAGLLLTVLSLDTGWTPAGAAAGAAFGLLAFARIDMMILVLPVVALFLALEWRGRALAGPTLAMAAVFTVVSAQGVLYGVTAALPYFARVASVAMSYAARHPSRFVLAGLLLIVVLGFTLSLLRTTAWSRVRTIVFATLAVTLIGWFTWRDLTRGRFVELLTPIGLAVGLGGLAALMARVDRRRSVLVALVFLAGLAYVGNLIDPGMPWALRRFVPILLPLVVLGIGCAVSFSAGRFPRPAVLLATIVVAGWFTWHSWPIVAHPVMRHGTAELEKVAAIAPASSLVLWDPWTPNHLALAAQYSLGRDSVVVPNHEAGGRVARRMVDGALSQGRPVRIVVDQRAGTLRGQPWAERLSGLQVTPAAPLWIRAESLVESRGLFPFRVHESARRLDVYDVARQLAAIGAASSRVKVDLGDADLPYLLEGFQPTEWHDDATVRWTGSTARLRLPPVARSASGSARLTLRLATHRPVDAPVMLDLDWNDEALGRLAISSAWAEYRVPVEAARAGGVSDLTLRSPTFVPRDVGMGSDGRALGVLVDWVVLEADSSAGEHDAGKPDERDQQRARNRELQPAPVRHTRAK